jgi:uncharacterized membrane protein
MRKKLVNLLLLAMLFVSLFIALAPSQVSAATIHGDVYDLSLDRLSNVAVEVNTTPNQRLISKNGSYSFTLPIGSYKITALQYQNNRTIAKAEENVQAIDNGDYVIDLFLYPNLEEEQSILNSTDLGILPEGQNSSLIIILIAIAILAGAAAGLLIVFIRSRKKNGSEQVGEEKGPKQKDEKPEGKQVEETESPKKAPEPEKEKAAGEAKPQEQEKSPLEEDEDLKRVIDVLKSEGGRATQKEVRKHIPLSEAKVSLIITELEAKGFIEKIKKGRGNIIILKRKT